MIDFSSIFNRYNKSGSFDNRIFDHCGFSKEEITFHNFFGSIEGYKVIINNQKAFFPKNLVEVKTSHADSLWLREVFFSINLVIPAYCPLARLKVFAKYISNFNDQKNKEKLANDFLVDMYSDERMASLCADIYTKKLMLPFYHDILESCQAYYAGLYKPAIITLIPCIEGIIKSIGEQVSTPIPKEINKKAILKILNAVEQDYINRELKEYDWLPPNIITMFERFDERIQMMEGIKFFIENLVYQDTRDANYSPDHQLNRHGIVHGFIKNFGHPINYLRLITLVNSLVLVSILAGDPGPCFIPEQSQNAKILMIHLKEIKKLVLPLELNRNNL